MKLGFGVDHAVKSKFAFLKGKRVALLSHLPATDSTLTPTVDRLFEAENYFSVKCLLGPQHGFFTTDQDNMIETPHSISSRYQVPIYSLYSESRVPTPEMLKDVDTLLIDLLDIGVRFYTYSVTVSYALEIASKLGIEVIVLDRPNPLGSKIQGPTLKPGFETFIGRGSLPIRHGMSLFELCLYFKYQFNLTSLNLKSVPHTFPDSTDIRQDFLWVPPSPNLPTRDSLAVYPGMCFLEGTTISEGRGTTTPFQTFGAPFIDSRKLLKQLNSFQLRGVLFRETQFVPTFEKHQGSVCSGIFIHVLDQSTFDPILTAIRCLQALATQKGFSWRNPPFEYETNLMPIDMLFGSDALRLAIHSESGLNALLDSIKCEEIEFAHAQSKTSNIYRSPSAHCGV